MQSSSSNNTDDLYPKANQGRLKMTDESLPEKAAIISKNVKGSDEYERFEQKMREAKAVELDDRLVGRIIVCTVGVFALGFVDYLYGRFLPVINYFVKGAALIFAGFLLYYLIRQLKISIDSRRFKKHRK